MRLILCLVLTCCIWTFSTNAQTSGHATPPPNDSTGKQPTEAGKSQTNLTEVMDKTGTKDFFKDAEKESEEMDKLRELSEQDKTKLKEALENSDADKLPETSKKLKDAMDLVTMSDDDLVKELDKPEEGKDGASKYSKKMLQGEIAARSKNASSKPDADSFKALQKLKADERTKALAEKLSNYKNLSPEEQNKVRAEVARLAVKDKAMNENYWGFFKQDKDNAAANSIEAAFTNSIFDSKLNGYEARYISKFDTRTVFEDKSGRKFSISGGLDESGKNVGYQKFLDDYKKTTSGKPTEDQLNALNNDLQRTGLTYHEKKGETVQNFKAGSTANGKFAFFDNETPKTETYTASKEMQNKLGIKDPIQTKQADNIRIWSASGKDGKTEVTSHQLITFDTKIPFKDAENGATLGLGYENGKYFLFSTKSDYSNVHRLMTESDKRMTYDPSYTSSNGVYLKRDSDGQYFKLTFNQSDPQKNSLESVNFSQPAPTRTVYFYNGNYYYYPVNGSSNYYQPQYYYSRSYFRGCST